MEKLRHLIQEVAEDLTPAKPSMLWLGIEQKGGHDGDMSSPFYPHVGSFIVKGDVTTAFPTIPATASRIGLGKGISLLHLTGYYRYEKDEGTYTRRTNPFKDFNEAYDVTTGQPIVEIAGGGSVPQKLKELGWTFNYLWFVLVVESSIKEPFGACFLLKKTSFASFRSWVKTLSQSKQDIREGLIKVTTQKQQNPKGGVYFIPQFELTPFSKVKWNDNRENQIIEALQTFKKQVEDYINSFKQPLPKEETESDFSEFNF